jgi:hypothetical protein
MKMRPTVRTIVLTLIVVAMISGAHADTLTLASVGTAANPNQTNSYGSTFPVTKNGDWTSPLPGSSWVSFAPTGGGANPKLTIVPVGTVVSFFDVFDVSGSATGGTLRVIADNSIVVILNGSVIYAEESQTGKGYSNCADNENACLSDVSIALPSKLLRHGPNKLEFRVAQQRGISIGLDYAGKVDLIGTVPTVYEVPPLSGNQGLIPGPESSSLTMLIAGMIVLAALMLLSLKKPPADRTTPHEDHHIHHSSK